MPWYTHLSLPIQARCATSTCAMKNTLSSGSKPPRSQPPPKPISTSTSMELKITGNAWNLSGGNVSNALKPWRKEKTMNNPVSNGYSPTERLVCTAARLMTDNTTAFIGTGIPMLAASLAQRMHAPNLVTIFEFGGTGAIFETLPMAVGGECTFLRSIAAAGICDVMEAAQRGFIEYGFIGGAQIDPYGNLNSTMIGDYYHPKVRLPGSGGGNDAGSHCWRTIAIMRHDKRRFIEILDFITTPWYLTEP